MNATRNTKFSLMLVTLLLLAAFYVRISHLNGTPPGISYDAASNLADALRIQQGIPLSMYLGTRPEPLYRFLLAGWYALTGTELFTANLLQSFMGIIGIALAYRTMLEILRRHAYRHAAGWVAAGALAASVSHISLSRIAERGVLLPVVLLAAVIVLLRAAHTRQLRHWLVAGGVTALAVYTYTAGLAALPWLAGFLLHQFIFQRGKRLSLREGIAAGGGVLLALIPWAILLAAQPALYYRVGQASANVADLTLVERLLRGLPVMLEAYTRGNDAGMFYNIPNTPPLHPIFLALAVLGLLLALWRWRQAEGALIVGGLVIFAVPALLSNDPQSSIRLTGLTTLLGVLAGGGAAGIIGFIMRPGDKNRRMTRRPEFGAGLVLFIPIFILIAAALINAHQVYQAFWTNAENYTRAPAAPDGIPYNYSIALTEALDALTKVTVPTYVPLKSVNSATAYYMLQREAYPNVTTWARYGLKELPAGQIFYPEYDYFHAVQSAQEPLMVLLLPAEKTLVILPPDDNQRIISRPASSAATIITSERYGWIIARTEPRPAMPLPELSLPENIPVFGSGLELINAPEDVRMTPGGLFDRVLLWRVTAPQPADLTSVLQVVDMQFNAITGHEYIVLEYLYPSGRWQAGDIVPDMHTLMLPSDAPDTLYRLGTGAYVVPFPQPLLTIQKPPVLNHPGTLWLWGVGRISSPPAVTPPENMIPLPGTQFANGVKLLGFTLDTQTSQWKIHLYWEAARLPEADMVIFVHALDSAGTLIGQSDGLPNNGQAPMWSWLPETIVTTTHEVTVSAEPAALSVGLYNPITLARVDATVNKTPVPDAAVTVWQMK